MSDDKVLFSNEWLELREMVVPSTGTPYVYVRGTKTDSISVAVLPYRISTYNKSREYILRREIVPPWDSRKSTVCSLTGGHDQETILDTAVKEVLEESGYVIDKSKLNSLGTSRLSKSSDYVCHLYVVEIDANTPYVEPEGDGSDLEEVAACFWGTRTDILNSPDPLLHIMMNRLTFGI